MICQQQTLEAVLLCRACESHPGDMFPKNMPSHGLTVLGERRYQRNLYGGKTWRIMERWKKTRRKETKAHHEAGWKYSKRCCGEQVGISQAWKKCPKMLPRRHRWLSYGVYINILSRSCEMNEGKKATYLRQRVEEMMQKISPYRQLSEVCLLKIGSERMWDVKLNSSVRIHICNWQGCEVKYLPDVVHAWTSTLIDCRVPATYFIGVKSSLEEGASRIIQLNPGCIQLTLRTERSQAAYSETSTFVVLFWEAIQHDILADGTECHACEQEHLLWGNALQTGPSHRAYRRGERVLLWASKRWGDWTLLSWNGMSSKQSSAGELASSGDYSCAFSWRKRLSPVVVDSHHKARNCRWKYRTNKPLRSCHTSELYSVHQLLDGTAKVRGKNTASTFYLRQKLMQLAQHVPPKGYTVTLFWVGMLQCHKALNGGQETSIWLRHSKRRISWCYIVKESVSSLASFQ